MRLHRMALRGLEALCFAVIASLTAGDATRLTAAEPASYGAVRDFLVNHTNVVELTGEHGERVAICPEYQGRVMTSTCGDLQGRSLGWVNRAFIEKGAKD